MEDEMFQEILHKLTTIRISEDDTKHFQLDNDALDIVRLWASNCCYGKVITERKLTFRSLRTTLDCVWAHSIFRMKLLPEGYYQIFFQDESHMGGILK